MDAPPSIEIGDIAPFLIFGEEEELYVAGDALLGDALAVDKGTYSVYQGFNAANEVSYIGITSRNPLIRFAEHASSGTPRAQLFYRVVDGATNLSKINAKIMEQNLINSHGLNNLLNMRNSIAPKYWYLYGIR